MAKKKITPKTFAQVINDLSTPRYVLGDLSSFTRDDVIDLRSCGLVNLGDLLGAMMNPTWVWPPFIGEKQQDRITDAALIVTTKALDGKLPKELTDTYELPEGLKTQKEKEDSKNNNTTVVVTKNEKQESIWDRKISDILKGKK